MNDREMRERVAVARVARLATITREGWPHVVPCCFVLDGDVAYSAVDGKPKSTLALRRLANVRANPRASLLVDFYADDWSKLWWVRVDGSGRVIEAGAEFEAAISRLTQKYGQYEVEPPPGPIVAIDLRDVAQLALSARQTDGVPIDLILDCDPGHDDAVALAVAAQRGRLLGVTTVAGNVPLALTTRNALGILQLLGADVEVHSGASMPRRGSPVDHAAHVHGETGLAGATLPELRRAIASDDAAAFILDITRRHPGAWIVATGPLTNIADALTRDPLLTERIAGISIMGGGTFGNVTAAAEFNIHFDPEAADIVLRCGAPLILCGLDLTHQLLVDDAMVARSRALGNDFGRFGAEFLSGYLANIRNLRGGDASDAALHDPCAVLAVTDPSLFELAPRPIVVETAGDHTRGMTVVDRRPRARNTNAQWALTIDAPTAIEVILAAFGVAP